ncbi:meiosis-specific nuclear structural protein 1-like [Anopheles aquasalis]|uniref:meiosis-specific nuclear structural protein 1-like n=1 Tax=Anopheles aquasalis TaxID=42839 RepID=UPI00215B058F|nr:meiosis-specific nuclear structural protein 1-like [Anopheles aquasalis]
MDSEHEKDRQNGEGSGTPGHLRPNQQLVDRNTAPKQQWQREERQDSRLLAEANRRTVNTAQLRQQLRESSQELRVLESKLRAAYVAKGIAAQLAEIALNRQREHLEDIKEQEELAKLQQKNAAYMQSLLEERAEEKRQLRAVLLEQISEARHTKQCLYEEFLREKTSLDAVVKKMQEEELEAIQRKLELRHCTRREMECFQEAKEQWRTRQRLLDEEENERIRQYCEEKVRSSLQAKQREQELTLQREQQNARMIGKLEQEEDEKRKREALLQELYMVEQNDREEVKRQRQLEETLRKRIEVRLSLEHQRTELSCQRQREEEETKRFQEEQIKAWSERDRIEQLSNEKRHRKMIEYRRAVQELLEERRRRRREDVQQALQQEEQLQREEKQRQEILEEERIKLLKEHVAALVGFLPPGILRETDREFIPLPKF